MVEELDLKKHWQTIYQTRDTTRVGWYQNRPEVSLDYIQKSGLERMDPLIDVGGGDSFLIDYLLDLGYVDITVLDISASALENTRKRIGAAASGEVKFVVTNILDFEPDQSYKLWHDRAVFHFLTRKEDQIRYRDLIERFLVSGGYFIIGTFSKKGPNTCSGLPVQQYDINDLSAFFSKSFDLIEGINYDHFTPSGSAQNYSFCLFRRK